MQTSLLEPRLDRGLGVALTAAAVAAIGLLSWLVLQRLGYPFELEWMEGAMVDEAARVRAGEPIYGPPTVDHVPFLYTPLFFQVGALAMAVLGEGFLALRVVSVLATLGCAWLLADLVRRETGRRYLGLVAAGLFCGGYGWLRTWYDLGRNDTLFVVVVLAMVRCARGGTVGAIAAGLLAPVAFLVKQTALFWLPWLLLAFVLRDGRKGAVTAALAVVGCGVAVLVGDAVTGEWFSFYVFTMAGFHGTQGDRWVGFWTEDLVPIAPLLAAAALALVGRWRAGERRSALALAALLLGGIATSYASRLHVGGFDNVLLYGFVAAVLVGPIAAAAAAPRARLVGLALLLLQFATLVFDPRALWQPRPPLLLDPRQALPTAAHRRASEELAAFVAAQPGDVWVVFHGQFGPRAGRPRTAHAQAIYDLLPFALAQPRDRSTRALVTSVERALAAGRFSAIVLEQPFGAMFEQLFAHQLAGFRRRPGELLAEPLAIRPLVGMETHSPYALVPER